MCVLPRLVLFGALPRALAISTQGRLKSETGSNGGGGGVYDNRLGDLTRVLIIRESYYSFLGFPYLRRPQILAFQYWLRFFRHRDHKPQRV